MKDPKKSLFWSLILFVLLASGCDPAPKLIPLPDPGNDNSPPELTVSINLSGNEDGLREGNTINEFSRVFTNRPVIITAAANDPQTGIQKISVQADLDFECRVLDTDGEVVTLGMLPQDGYEDRSSPSPGQEVFRARSAIVLFRFQEADERCASNGYERARGVVVGEITAVAKNYEGLSTVKRYQVRFSIIDPPA